MRRDASSPSVREREDLQTTAIDAARLAGEVLLEYARTGFHVEYKNAVNLVTDADRRAEQVIVDTIHRAYPDHSVLAEERGMEPGRDSPYRWIIDPLDGTTNFAHGFPLYCVSIGVEYRDRMILGVVLDPTRQELFVAADGQGAMLNGQPIRVSKSATLETALLVTGFAYDIRESTHNNLDYFSKFCLCARGVRRTGTAALDLCYVAAGRLDGFWEQALQPWDVAAGALIVQEAGGRVTDLAGGPYSSRAGNLIASNGHIHEAMVEIVESYFNRKST